MHLDLETLRQIIETWGYLIVFGGVALESTGIPFPGETVLLVGAALAASSSRLHIEWVILWAAAGAILGDNGGYWAGRKLGHPLLKKVGPLLHFDAKKQAKIEGFFERHGAKTVFLGRFIALLRTWAAFFAGLNRMKYSTFLAYNALGGILWALAIGILGFLFGQNLPLLEKWLGDFSFVVLGILALGVILFLVFRHFRPEEKARWE
jgi:membrane protein DedA with SNARE-associated domain